MGHHGNHPNPSNHRDSSGVPDVGKPWLATSDRNSFLAAMVWPSLVNAKPKIPKYDEHMGKSCGKKISQTIESSRNFYQNYGLKVEPSPRPREVTHICNHQKQFLTMVEPWFSRRASKSQVQFPFLGSGSSWGWVWRRRQWSGSGWLRWISWLWWWLWLWHPLLGRFDDT